MRHLDDPLPPETPLRLMVSTGRGYQIVLRTTAGNQAAATAWALQSMAIDHGLRWKFEQTSGKLVRDELWARFNP